jgi:hypothetical protein
LRIRKGIGDAQKSAMVPGTSFGEFGSCESAMNIEAGSLSMEKNDEVWTENVIQEMCGF